MGNFFNTICMKAAPKDIRRTLTAFMRSHGFKPAKQNPQLIFCIVPGPNAWYSLHFDMFEDESMCNAFAPAFSADFNCAVFHCVDSDFLYIDLYKNGSRGSACAGLPYDEDPPSPDPAFWSEFTGDFDRFLQILSAKRTFAEDALYPLSEIFGFDPEILLLHPKDIVNNPPKGAVICGFSKKGPKKPLTIQTGPTLLKHQYSQPLRACRIGAPYHIGIHNHGGPSVGLEIVIEGTFDPCKVSFESAVVWSPGQRPDDFYLLKEQSHLHYGQFIPIDSCDERTRLRAVFPDFRIPEGITCDYDHLPFKQRMMICHQQLINFNFTMRADRYPEVLRITFIPIENPAGAYTWSLDACQFTPQEEEILHEAPWKLPELLASKKRDA